jgi:hypothetical protein
MKKKVRYAATAVGMAAPAFGLMMPAAVAASAHPLAANGKTVRLLEPQSVSPATGCTASSEVVKSTGPGQLPNHKLTYWWKENIQEHVCIGTAKGQVSRASLQGQALSFRVRVYLGTAKKVDDVVRGTCYAHNASAMCTGVRASIGVHTWILGPDVNVCGAWLWATGPFKGTAAWPATCKSVP